MMVLKGIGKIDGDGWKDTTKKGEVVFVYSEPLPSPYFPTQYERIGNVGWTATDGQYSFYPASIFDFARLLPTIWRDRKDRRTYAFRRTK